jgi:LysM repeat protein
MRGIRIISLVLAVAFMAGWLAFGPSAQAAETCQAYHTVQAGENLFRISLRYGTTMGALQALNNVSNPNLIYAGQRLCVNGTPGGNTPPPSNPAPSNPTQSTYTVQRGDTLSMIARRFGVSVTLLARVNNLANPSLIYVGQVLNIPAEPGQPTNNDVVLPAPPSYVIARTTVNLRSGPGFDFVVEGQMRPGEQAHVTGTSPDRQWWRVTCAVDASSNCWVTSNPAYIQVVALPQAPG